MSSGPSGSTDDTYMKSTNELPRTLTENEADTARLDWLIENATIEGGGNGFELKVWIPFDSECVRNAIDHAIGKPIT